MLGLRTSPRAPRRVPIPAVALCVTALLFATTSCDAVSWKLGRTHGAIIEVGAHRASLGIYRVPRRLLFQLYKGGGLKVAQDALWASGAPPVAAFSIDGVRVSTEFLNRKLHGYLYGDPADFRGALIDAERSRDCLALTLISRGLYIKNWTHKSVGCRMGSLP